MKEQLEIAYPAETLYLLTVTNPAKRLLGIAATIVGHLILTIITVEYGNDPNSQLSHMWEIAIFEKIERQWKTVLAQSTSPKISTKE